MSTNYKVWNVRKRHEWLAKPLKKKRIKRRSARRVGLYDAWVRRGLVTVEAGTADGAGAEAAETGSA